MEQNLINYIKKLIVHKSDKIFYISDLCYNLPTHSYSSIKRTINELSHCGFITNIARGLYFKPKYIKSINSYSCPTCEDFINAIANKNKWVISLTGYCALNALGLTTQVPTSYVYVSTGPNKVYKFNNTIIYLKHCKQKELIGYSSETKLLIQALKTLGKDNITKNVIESIKSLYPSSIKKTIKKECRGTTIWIQEKIQQICQ